MAKFLTPVDIANEYRTLGWNIPDAKVEREFFGDPDRGGIGGAAVKLGVQLRIAEALETIAERLDPLWQERRRQKVKAARRDAVEQQRRQHLEAQAIELLNDPAVETMLERWCHTSIRRTVARRHLIHYVMRQLWQGQNVTLGDVLARCDTVYGFLQVCPFSEIPAMDILARAPRPV